MLEEGAGQGRAGQEGLTRKTYSKEQKLYFKSTPSLGLIQILYILITGQVRILRNLHRTQPIIIPTLKEVLKSVSLFSLYII